MAPAAVFLPGAVIAESALDLLAKLTLELAMGGFAWDAIRFTRADDNGATVPPCHNCRQWLEEIPGPHPQQMRLNMTLLGRLGMLATEGKAPPPNGPKAFPSLRARNPVRVPGSAMK